MNTFIETEIVDGDETSSVGPGARLAQVRQAAQFSVDDIASRLHLRSDIIHHIERDDYSDMPSFVFVRGYLRAYAKLLGLNADEIIEKFDDMAIDEPESERLVRQLPAEPVWSAKKRNLRRSVLVAVLSLITIMFVWWQANKATNEDAEDIGLAATPQVNQPSVHGKTQTATLLPPETVTGS